jgi:hypothetical protein
MWDSDPLIPAGRGIHMTYVYPPMCICCVYVYVYMYMCICVLTPNSYSLHHLHTYTPTHLNTYTPTHLHIYTHTHLHTYTPTHLHTYTPTANVSPTERGIWNFDPSIPFPGSIYLGMCKKTVLKLGLIGILV